jgi:hypothetical protein
VKNDLAVAPFFEAVIDASAKEAGLWAQPIGANAKSMSSQGMTKSAEVGLTKTEEALRMVRIDLALVGHANSHHRETGELRCT